MDSLFTSYGSSPVLVSDPLSLGSVEAGSDSMDRLEYLSGKEGREVRGVFRSVREGRECRDRYHSRMKFPWEERKGFG